MVKPNLPAFLYGETAHLVDAFCTVAAESNATRTDAEELFRLLPIEVKAAPAFVSKIGDVWRYEFGSPLEGMHEGRVAIGTHQFPEVKHLYLGAAAAVRHLDSEQLLEVLKRLADPAKHHGALFELAPITRIGSSVSVQYEVAGAGNRTIDWQVTPTTGIPVLLEMKFRIGDIVEHLRRLPPRTRAMETSDPGPGDPSILFRDTVDKFLPNFPSDVLQGAWVHAHVKVPEPALRSHFESLPPEKLHFAILATWGPEAFIIARPEVATDSILELFHLEVSDDFVIKDYDNGS